MVRARRLEVLPGPRLPTLVWTGRGALEAYARSDDSWLRDRSLFVVTDRRVARLHGERLEALRQRAAKLRLYRVASGETAKSLQVAERLWRRLLRDGARRDSCLVAFGGGSVGDLAGFVASTLLRGITLLQLPTTLLAQVDAALGGKTAIDLPEAKNCVGTFYHPRAVIAEPALLGTLARREMASGLAEVIKIGAVLDARLFRRLERGLDAALGGDTETLSPVISAAQALKMTVVGSDPFESDSRRVLNFGHTLGHAIETVLGYGRFRHGEAVAYGMLFALRLAVLRGLDPAVERRITMLIRRLPLPPLPPMSAARLIAAISRDKKSDRGGVVWVLPTALGVARMDREVEPVLAKRELAAFLHSETIAV